MIFARFVTIGSLSIPDRDDACPRRRPTRGDGRL